MKIVPLEELYGKKKRTVAKRKGKIVSLQETHLNSAPTENTVTYDEEGRRLRGKSKYFFSTSVKPKDREATAKKEKHSQKTTKEDRNKAIRDYRYEATIR